MSSYPGRSSWPRCPALRRCGGRWSWWPPTGRCRSAIPTCPPRCCPRAGRGGARTSCSPRPTMRCTAPLTRSSGISSTRDSRHSPAPWFAAREVTMTENFVLVHGAWHGGWAWQPVASRLRAAGHRVWAPPCPGLGIDDDPRGVTLAGCIDSVVSQIEASFAVEVTLVGHSWGGYVIAGAAPRLASRLKSLVFWSAFVPESGRPLYDEIPPSYQELFTSLAGSSGDNTVAMPLEVFQGAFMGDAEPVAAAAVHSVLRPQPFRTFTDPPADEAYRNLGIPLHYVLSSEDVALPPGEFGWDRFAERIKVSPVRVPGSHESMFTRPAELAGALAQAATA